MDAIHAYIIRWFAKKISTEKSSVNILTYTIKNRQIIRRQRKKFERVWAALRTNGHRKLSRTDTLKKKHHMVVHVAWI